MPESGTLMGLYGNEVLHLDCHLMGTTSNVAQLTIVLDYYGVKQSFICCILYILLYEVQLE